MERGTVTNRFEPNPLRSNPAGGGELRGGSERDHGGRGGDGDEHRHRAPPVGQAGGLQRVGGVPRARSRLQVSVGQQTTVVVFLLVRSPGFLPTAREPVPRLVFLCCASSWICLVPPWRHDVSFRDLELSTTAAFGECHYNGIRR